MRKKIRVSVPDEIAEELPLDIVGIIKQLHCTDARLEDRSKTYIQTYKYITQQSLLRNLANETILSSNFSDRR